MRTKTVASFFFLFTFLQTAFCQNRGTDETVNAILTKYGKVFVKDKSISSATIGIYQKGEIYTQHFGELHKGQGDTPTDETIYEIGSVTKPMTGFLVAKAVLDGKLQLSDTVQNYLEGDYQNLSYQGDPITIQHLLTHTSGLPTFLPKAMGPLFENLNDDVPTQYFELEKQYDKTRFFEDLKSIQLVEKPGTTYNYSNAGVDLLGHILEQVYDKDIDSLLKENLFTPNQMENTGIHLPTTKLDNLTQGYWKTNTSLSPNQLNTLWATGSGAKSTIVDMLKFIALQLDQNNATVQESQRVLFEGEELLKVGYLWRVWGDKYGRSYNHHGGTTGMQNWLFIFPKYDLGISIITNQSGPKTPGKLSNTAQKILKALVKA
ncbi:serine hydrolase domain-containing protein [Croceivirga thetidis]|uniref:Beta-lactamase family protein n=1 Tax=Croceivirga thetidis TaxID=2721623 RepID=A0ABX1GRY6_9FLAO|nr:serine hydrolase domain-containing protein [Croceivirga thetidis]NKI31826.1 beta-lactamase family protein [Croceivirga thetidis]